MNYCPSCGAPLAVGQNFCRRCGLDLRAHQVGETREQVASPEVKGLARNRVVYLSQEGLVGVKIQSETTPILAALSPLPLLAAFWYLTQAGSIAVYVTVWFVAAALLVDTLKARALSRVNRLPDQAKAEDTWIVPWNTLRMVDWNGRTLWFSRRAPPRRASITFDRQDSLQVETSMKSWGVRYALRPPRLPPTLTTFWALVILTFFASQAVMFLAATLPFFPGEEQVYTTVLNSTRSQVVGATFLDQFRFIYLNNLQVAWGSMIPGLGALSFFIASYNTGRVIQVIAANYGATLHQNISPALVFASLYLYPHSWVEELSYPIATIAGLLGITKWRSVSPEEFGRPTNRGSTKLLLALGGVALSLMAAAFLEVSEPLLGHGAFVLWVPVGTTIFLLVMLKRRRSHRSQESRIFDLQSDVSLVRQT